MQRGSPPTVGLPGQRALPGGRGRCRGAPLVLSTVLRRARVRHRAACAAPLTRKGRSATTGASPARAVPGRAVITPRDLLFQQDITDSVRRTYAAIPTGAGEVAAQRLYSGWPARSDRRISGVGRRCSTWAVAAGSTRSLPRMRSDRRGRPPAAHRGGGGGPRGGPPPPHG